MTTVAELVALFLRYASHDRGLYGCQNPGDRCDCGFSAALRSFEEAAKAETDARRASVEPRAAPTPALPREAPEPGGARCDCGAYPWPPGTRMIYGAHNSTHEPAQCANALGRLPRAAPSDSAPATPGLRSLVEQARDLIGVYAPDETILLGRLTAAIARLDAAPATPGLGPPSAGVQDPWALLREARAIINRDRTGLAAGLNAVQSIVKGYRWIPAGEWGNYSWDEQTETAFRAEVGSAFEAISIEAARVLSASGKLANESCRRIDDALQRASGEPRVASPEDTQKNTLRAATSGTSNPEER